MKPIAEKIEGRSGSGVSSDRRQLPFVDWNYQAFSLDRSYGGSADNSSKSFLNISRDYFRREARRNLLAEIAFFLVLAAIWAGAFVEGARAIIHFLHLPTA